MTPEQILIQQISRLIENNQLERNPTLEDYAFQYAELCTSANTRLLRCASYLEQGLLSEVVYEVRTAPDLLELVSLIQFEHARKWRNICHDLELEQPPLLHTEIVEKVQEACDRGKRLQPLLSSYRSYIYQGQKRLALEKLREIRALDPDNPSWSANLQALEAEELPAWLDKAEQAIRDDDQQELREIYQELTHPFRTVLVDEHLRQRLRRALLRQETADLRREADLLLEVLAKAQDEDRVADVEKALARVREIEAKEAFLNRPPDWTARIGDCQQWLSDRQKQARQEQQFQAELTAFSDKLLTAQPTELEVKHDLEHLRQSGFPVPADLERQAHEYLQSKHRARQRKQQFFAAAVIIGLLVVAGLAVVWYNRQVREGRRFSDLAHMELLLYNGQDEELDLYLQSLEQNDPQFAQTPKVRNFREKLQANIQRRQEAQTRLKLLQDKLQALAKADYRDPGTTPTSLLDEAKGLASSPADRQWLHNWETTWQAALAQRKSAVQTALSRTLTKLKFEFKQFQEAKRLDGEAIARQQRLFASELNSLLASIQADAPEEMPRHDEAQRILSQWKQEAQTRLAQQKAQQDSDQQKAQRTDELLHILEECLPNLDTYFATLQELKQISPEAFKPFRQAADCFPAQQDAIALNVPAIRDFPASDAACQAVQDACQDIADNHPLSVWGKDLQWCQKYLSQAQGLRQKLPSLLLGDNDMFRFYSLKYREKGATEWQYLYLPSLPNSQVKDGVTLYFGPVYACPDPEEAPVVLHSSKVFSDKPLNTANYDIEIAFREQNNYSPQWRFLNDFIAKGRSIKEIDVFLLQQLKELNSRLDIPRIPRLWLQKRLLALLAQCFPEDLPQALDWLSRLNEIPTQVPWMNPNHPETKKTLELLNDKKPPLPDQELDDLCNALQNTRKLTATVLSTKMRCCGQLLPDGRELRPAFCENGYQGELWILDSPTSAATPRWLVLGNHGKLIPAILRNCYPGQLIFAPENPSIETPEARQALQTQCPGSLRQPYAWPLSR